MHPTWTSRHLSALRLSLLVSLLLGGASPGQAAEIVAIRHWSDESHTRVVLDLDEAMAYEARVLTAPDRIAVDVPGGRIASSVYAFAVGDGVLERVRVNRLRGPTAQVVLDLVGPRQHAIFALEADGDHPPRIVVDVFRPTSGAPRGDDSISPIDDGRHVVVLDPGHGGADPGAVHNDLLEKTLTLRAAIAVEKALRARASEVEVVLTRDGDERLSLRERYRTAEARGADVFISLHANAAPVRGAQGSEVYFLTLGEATDTEARRIAELENAADLVGGAPAEAEGDLVSILADLQMKSTLSRSSIAAEAILDGLAARSLLRARSVKQARFVVLQSARVPSVLLEIGFLSNSHDAKLLRRQEFLDAFAAAVADGIVAYLARLESP